MARSVQRRKSRKSTRYARTVWVEALRSTARLRQKASRSSAQGRASSGASFTPRDASRMQLSFAEKLHEARRLEGGHVRSQSNLTALGIGGVAVALLSI